MNAEDSSVTLNNFKRGLPPQSPHLGLQSNDVAEETSSHDNFLKTGDNNLDCINVAGHVTNFVDNEASLDFLSQSNLGYQGGVFNPEILQQQLMDFRNNNNFSQLMRDFDGEQVPRIHKSSSSRAGYTQIF
jgi:hypothetical protein